MQETCTKGKQEKTHLDVDSGPLGNVKEIEI